MVYIELLGAALFTVASNQNCFDQPAFAAKMTPSPEMFSSTNTSSSTEMTTPTEVATSTTSATCFLLKLPNEILNEICAILACYRRPTALNNFGQSCWTIYPVAMRLLYRSMQLEFVNGMSFKRRLTTFRALRSDYRGLGLRYSSAEWLLSEVSRGVHEPDPSGLSSLVKSLALVPPTRSIPAFDGVWMNSWRDIILSLGSVTHVTAVYIPKYVSVTVYPWIFF